MTNLKGAVPPIRRPTSGGGFPNALRRLFNRLGARSSSSCVPVAGNGTRLPTVSGHEIARLMQEADARRDQQIRAQIQFEQECN